MKISFENVDKVSALLTLNIEKKDYTDYLAKLEKASGIKVVSFETLVKALVECMDFFAENIS